MADGDVSGGVVLRDRFEIDPRQPLSAYDSPTALAYRAASPKDGRSDLLALVCDPTVPPRTEAMDALRGSSQRALMRLLDWGVVGWPLTRRRHVVAVFEQPQGDRVMPALNRPIEPIDEDRLVAGFLGPVVPVLRELTGRGVTHRNLRPTNVFYQDAKRRYMILGECVTAPPAYNQPTWIEPIESAMALPSGRGEGTPADDVYALGGTLLALLVGRNPVPDVMLEMLIDAKINTGSYGALVGGIRLSQGMVELLRGMLSDDLRERWSIREVELWLGGRRLTPKQAKLPDRASRPVVFQGREHFNTRALANGLALNWLTAGQVVRSSDFENWLTRSLGDANVQASVQKAVGTHASLASGSGEDDRLVARAAIALDPAAPIRHKGVGVHLDGFGLALAVNFDDDNTRQICAEIINGRFAILWLSMQTRSRPELMRLHGVFERLPSILGQTGPGFGIERVLYELNPNLPCKSPMIFYQYVTRIEELMPALEVAAQHGNRPTEPIDRHIVAFIASRSGQVDDRLMRPLVSRDDAAAYAVAVVKLLARVQGVARAKATPNLSAWLATLMKPAITSFHNLKVRRIFENSLKKAAESGQLLEMQQIFDDPRAIQMDQRGYARAVAEHQQCQNQIAILRAESDRRDAIAAEMGEQVAAVISGVIGSIAATAIIIMYVF